MKGKKILNRLTRFFFGRFVARIEKKVNESKNEEVKTAANATIDLAEDYAHILTDNDPNNSEQIKAYLESNKAQHVNAGVAILNIPIGLIKDETLQADAREALEVVNAILLEELGGEEEEVAPVEEEVTADATSEQPSEDETEVSDEAS